MTKRQKIIRHLVCCYRKLAQDNLNNKKLYYWEQQIKKGLKLVNIKSWSI